MKAYDKSKPLYSIHIPKCGGSSFLSVLQQWFGHYLFLHYFNEKMNLMPENHRTCLHANSCVHGHFNRSRGFGVESYYPQAEQYITIMRDPFEILVSRYFYMKKIESKGLLFRDGTKLTIPGDVNEFLENEITNPNYHPNILTFLPYGLNAHNYKEVLNSKFVYIGVSDDLNQSVGILSSKLGKPAVDVPRVNIAERDAVIDLSLKSKFEQTHSLEYSIYKYVLDNYLIW